MAVRKEDSPWSVAAEQLREELTQANQRCLGFEKENNLLKTNAEIVELRMASLQVEAEALKAKALKSEENYIQAWRKLQDFETRSASLAAQT